MRLRAPAYPLITIDPHFSVWSMSDKLTDKTTMHWTCKPNTIIGTACIDGNTVRIIGADTPAPAMKQVSVDMSAFSTKYVFEDLGVRLTLTFTSPIIPSDLYLLSRPVSYLEIKNESIDGKKHTVSVKIAVSEEICMNLKGDDEVVIESIDLGKLSSVKMGRKNPRMLERHGDDLRIDWGYFYLTSEGTTDSYKAEDGMTYVSTELPVKSSALITFAYDDIYSIEYFHKQLRSYWNRNGALITDEIVKAHADYKATMKKCAERILECDRAQEVDSESCAGIKYMLLLP